jgi:hypothetical protein
MPIGHPYSTWVADKTFSDIRFAFEYLDRNQSFVLRFVHTGDASTEIHLLGAINGAVIKRASG